VHVVDGLRRRLHLVRRLHHDLEAVRQRVLVAERIEQVFLVAEALRKALLCLVARHIVTGLDALQLADLRADGLLLLLCEPVLQIDADLHLVLEPAGQAVHVEHQEQEHAEHEERDGHRADGGKAHPAVPLEAVKDLADEIFRRLHPHAP
jgi:hypothetical protein